MPYIRQDRRRMLDDGLETPQTAGELNFAITRLCTNYLPVAPGYDAFNEIMGALECAKLELYRRMVTPYEDRKIEENGDVYPH